MTTTLTNVHPADELSDLRLAISQMQKRADYLRDQLLTLDADLKGDTHTAVLVPGKRETLDRKAITEAFGEDVIASYLKKTTFTTAKLVEND